MISLRCAQRETTIKRTVVVNFVQFVENSCTVQYTPEERHVKTGKLKSACRFQRFCVPAQIVMRFWKQVITMTERNEEILFSCLPFHCLNSRLNCTVRKSCVSNWSLSRMSTNDLLSIWAKGIMNPHTFEPKIHNNSVFYETFMLRNDRIISTKQ